MINYKKEKVVMMKRDDQGKVHSMKKIQVENKLMLNGPCCRAFLYDFRVSKLKKLLRILKMEKFQGKNTFTTFL